MLGKSLKIASVLLLMAAVAAAQSIPAGTKVTVRMGSGINSGTARSGQMFDATLARDLVVNGKTLAKAGAPAHGKVIHNNHSMEARASRPRRTGEDARLSIEKP